MGDASGGRGALQTVHGDLEVMLADLNAGEFFSLDKGCYAGGAGTHEWVKDTRAASCYQFLHQGQRLADLVELASGQRWNAEQAGGVSISLQRVVASACCVHSTVPRLNAGSFCGRWPLRVFQHL